MQIQKIYFIIGILLIVVGFFNVIPVLFGTFLQNLSDAPDVVLLGTGISLLWSVPFFIIGIIMIKKFSLNKANTQSSSIMPKTPLFVSLLALIVVTLFFVFTQPSTFDFLMMCPDGYHSENLFCYPDNMLVDTAASDWRERLMMLNDPIIVDPHAPCVENCD